MPRTLPKVLHTYQNHTLDSTAWHNFVPRDDDIVISSSLKSGTTWTQSIVAHLILGTASIPDVSLESPWLDSRMRHDHVLNQVATQQHRRFIKSHLPLDGLPFHPQIKYIILGRDARDVFMSLWNHHTSYLDSRVAEVNAFPGRVGPPHARGTARTTAFWRDWITRGWFEWESEGYPYWGNMHHTRTWWEYRDLDNILFVHYNDLLADLPGEIRRIAQFLEIACSDQVLADVAQAVTFSTMKQNAAQLYSVAERVWQGGGQTFIFKGTNGRWRDVLSPEELALYAGTVGRVLPPDCAAWLEHGRSALSH